MAGSKISRKVRFFPYFPYGYCSKLATTIEGMENPYATLHMLGDDPDAVIAKCDQYRKTILDRTRYLCDKNYARDTRKACGTPSTQKTFRQITKLGLTVLIEAPDEAATEDYDDAPETSTINGKIKEDHFRSNSIPSCTLRELLYDCATSDDAIDRQTFDDLLLDAVINGRVTPLTYAIDQVQNTKINPGKHSQNQRYNVWRLSHINAMFLANDHLTYLDRRPYNTKFAIDGIADNESYNAYIEKHGHTVASLTYYALTNWYKNNPGFYQITQRHPDTSEEGKEAWINTPAFYATRELPNFNERISLTQNPTAKGRPQTLNTIHVGLAIGKNVNYVCYHGKQGEFKWIKKREQVAKEETEKAVLLMKTQCPEMHCRDTVDSALYFCSSHHQFLALFNKTRTRHIRNKKLDYATDNPYITMHCIPVNDSGTYLLWCLLEYSPVETAQRIHNNLVSMDIGFAHAANLYYPLTYEGKRVFSGYTMDISKINNVLEDYLDGHDFYICCFPDQAPWYKRLFPGRTIL